MTERLRAAAAAAVVALTGAAACQVGGDTTPSAGQTEGTDGPLALTLGHMTNMLSPVGQDAFVAIPACVEDVTEPQQLRLEAVSADKVRGTSKDTIGFLAAWPAQDEPLEIAAGPMSALEEPFTADVAGADGSVMPCGHPSSVTGLEIATVVPEAGETAVVVDGFTVTYTIGDQRYTEQVDVTLGMCSAHPADPAAEPTECR